MFRREIEDHRAIRVDGDDQSADLWESLDKLLGDSRGGNAARTVHAHLGLGRDDPDHERYDHNNQAGSTPLHASDLRVTREECCCSTVVGALCST